MDIGHEVSDTNKIKPIANQPVTFVDDNFLWCHDCGISAKDPCLVHGQLIRVKDKVIPTRAKLTVPHLLCLKKVEYLAGEDAVYGVFARKVIQQRTQFGPYESTFCDEWCNDREDRLQLKVFLHGERSKFLNYTDQAICNWMMFVRPARFKQEQNLVAYQYKGSIFFNSTKHIPLGTELRVWYAEHYRAWLEQDGLKVRRIPISENFEIDETENTSSQYDEDVASPAPEDALILQIDPSLENAGVDLAPAVETEDQYPVIMEDDKQGEGAIHINSLHCGVCGHSFEEEEEPDHVCNSKPNLGRHTQSKRKGRPTKLAKGGKRKRGRPRKIKTLEEIPHEIELPPSLPKEEIKTDNFPEEEVPVKRKRGRPKKYEMEMVENIPVKTRKLRKVKTPKSRKSKLTSSQVHICDTCNKAFSTATKLKLHMYTHTGERPHRCDCGAAFTTKFKLDRHGLIHANDRQFTCCYCQKTFARKDHLKNHIRVHDPNKSVFHCDQCNKTYATSYCFRTHMAFHAFEKGEMSCLVCKEEFEDKTKMLLHLKFHAGSRAVKGRSDRKHKCPMCQKSFFTKKDVRRHVVVHTKNRDFLCQFCPQTFGRRDHLVRHVTKTHSSECDADKQSPGTSRRRRGSANVQKNTEANLSREDLYNIQDETVLEATEGSSTFVNPAVSSGDHSIGLNQEHVSFVPNETLENLISVIDPEIETVYIKKQNAISSIPTVVHAMDTEGYSKKNVDQKASSAMSNINEQYQYNQPVSTPDSLAMDSLSNKLYSTQPQALPKPEIETIYPMKSSAAQIPSSTFGIVLHPLAKSDPVNTALGQPTPRQVMAPSTILHQLTNIDPAALQRAIQSVSSVTREEQLVNQPAQQTTSYVAPSTAVPDNVQQATQFVVSYDAFKLLGQLGQVESQQHPQHQNQQHKPQ